jgi:hypothetical protein
MQSIEVVYLETRLVVFLFKKRVTYKSPTGAAAIFNVEFYIISLVRGSAFFIRLLTYYISLASCYRLSLF